MTASSRKRILFSGYAPVHFLCALPVCRLLASDPRIELWYSGGFRKGTGEEATYSIEGFYDPWISDRSRVIPIERAREEDFDVLLSAHLSPALHPRFAGQKVQIFHGVSFKNLLVREKYLAYDTLCLAGKYHADQYLRKGFVRPDAARCLVTGFPKADALVSGSLDRAAALRSLGLDPDRQTVLFAPTGSKHNSLDLMGKEIMRAFSADGRWNLMIKPHDHPKDVSVDWFHEIDEMRSDRLRVIRDLDIVPYLGAADLLLTDASSAAVEYTLLDRPIVFVDVPELFRDVIARDGALDLDTFGRRIGVVVRRPEEIVPAVADALAHPGREREWRRKTAALVFHRPGNAAQRVADVVLHAAGLIPAIPPEVEILEALKPLGRELPNS